MIRGALVLAIGVVAGYAKAVSEQEVVREGITDVANAFKEVATRKDPEYLTEALNYLKDAPATEILVVYDAENARGFTVGDLRSLSVDTQFNTTNEGDDPS